VSYFKPMKRFKNRRNDITFGDFDDSMPSRRRTEQAGDGAGTRGAG
jgi:hypothetical protein